jgi:cell division protein FtsL
MTGKGAGKPPDARAGRGRLDGNGGQHTARFHREPDRGLRRVMAAALLGCAALVASVLGVVGLKVQQVRLSYQLDGLRQVRAEEEEAVRRLGVELQTLRSLGRIEEVAQRQLGMVWPERDQVLLAREFVAAGRAAGSAHVARRSAAVRPGGPAAR